MKKVLLLSVLLGGLMVGCSQAEKPTIEELQETIKEQEQYIAELEQYKQEQENFERQARQMQEQLDYEEEQANKEKYYMAITDVRIISNTTIADSELSNMEYGNYYAYDLTTTGYYDDILNPSAYRCYIDYRYIPSGTTFKLSDNMINNYTIKGDYEEITINQN